MVEPVTTGSIGAFGLILKGLKTIKDAAVSVEVKSQVTELYDVILAGQQSALEENIKQRALLEEIRDLKEQIANLEAWDAEKQRYKLAEPWAGAVVFALKKSSANGEPPHYLCTHCYQDRRASILSDMTKYPTKGAQGHSVLLLKCDRCESELHSGWHGGRIERKYAEDLTPQ
jgi:hypothetical protein